jgi:DNA helicase-2/ATP-dependent DNA helicase PcrA
MITKEFKKEYARLNPEQKLAVDTIEGPVMVIAGPGTGKTTILTLRIANILLKTDTPPSGILALTFTESGAKAMRAKLREVIGERAFEVAIHTFHGFAAKVIAEFGENFPHISRSKQITDIEVEKILREILKQKKFNKLRPIGDPDFYISKIVAAISNAKQEAWTPEMIKSFAKDEIERIKSSPESISSRGKSKGDLKAPALRLIERCERTILFADVYDEFERRKKEERKIDFDDLIFELLQALDRDELLLQSLQEKYLYILLDEHQDTNDTQNLIVRRLADFFETPNLFVVGDEKQAIYRFQGASVENFLSFQKIWSQMKVISLTDNYRSHQHILDASFRMIEQNYTGKEHLNLRVKLKSSAKEKAKPLDFVIAPDTETEEAYLIEELQKLIKKEPEATLAIIVRKNSEVAKIFSLLEDAGISASAERGANIFSHPVGILYFSLLEFLVDPSKTESLGQTFAGGLWHLNFEKQVELIKFARSGKFLEIEKEIKMISKLQKEISSADPLEFLYLAADLSGFTEIAAKNPLSVEVWRGIIGLAEDLILANQIENAKSLIKEMLDYKKSAERRAIKINTGEAQSKIIIMTAHGSKGLEFDYVFLPYASEESWIRKNHGSYFVLPKEKEEDDDIRDERRLFYVALTRAKKHVCISFHLKDNTGRAETALRFIDELDKNFISQIALPKISKPKILQNLDTVKIKQDKEKVEYAKSVLLENGLSVTALNHFIECPNKFFYKSILKLPEAPSGSSEKGSAMHEAIANVWKFGKKSENAVSAIIQTSVQNYFKHSLLLLHEKEAVLDELITNAPKVAAALKDHFSQKGNVSVESWVESYFKYPPSRNFGVANEIKLHGKLDALLEGDSDILIYDYKTKEAMSPNAIKGETRGSDGNYFRQLIFYKMLLMDNLKFKGKKIEPALVFVKPDKAGRCPTISLAIEKSDIEKVKSEINLLIESVWSGKFLTQTCDDKNCQYCGFKKL